jgi:hypothetical protein
MRQRARIIVRIRRNLGKGDVVGCLDEFLELPVGHSRPVHPKRVDRDAVDRRLFRIVFVGAHAKGAAGNAHHVRVTQTLRRQTFITLIRLRVMEQHPCLPRYSEAAYLSIGDWTLADFTSASKSNLSKSSL